MTFKRIGDLTEDTSPAVTDLVETEKDPSGTPLSRKVALSDILALGVAGVVDHGGLTGLGDDDHTIYALVDGSRVFTGQIRGSDATAAAPSYTFTTDTDLGLYWVSSGVMGIAAGGASVMTIGSGTTSVICTSTTAGFRVPVIAGDPATPADGDMWYDSVANAFQGRVNGGTVTFTVT